MWLLDFCSNPLLRWSLAASICLFSQITLQASEIFLNDSMPKDVQKKTGVADLNYQQRLALEKWLNDTFVLKNPPEKQKGNANLYLSQNIDNGKVLELSDGSRWEVAPDDVESAAFWITPFSLYFTPNTNTADNGTYPVKIVNENTGIGVKVKQLRKANEVEAPPSSQ
jgi:hypothetical protein